MERSPVVQGSLAAWYAKHYYTIEDDIRASIAAIDTPFLDERLRPKMRVFDAMMGRGRHALRYAKRGCSVWGNDLNPHMVVQVKAAARKAKAPLRLSDHDASHMPKVPSDRFDVTFAMFSSLGTIPKRERRRRAVREFARVTRPGGLVIVHAHNRWDTLVTPGFMGWALRSYVWPEPGLATGDMVTDYNGLRSMFNHFYSPRELRFEFRQAGLDVVEEHYFCYEKKRLLTGPLRKLRADGFIFVGKKR